MSKINLSVSDNIVNGKQISFLAPCGSHDATSLVIQGVEYSICDASCNALGQKSNLWNSNAIVSVILDTDNKKAYVQNANTNNYIESELSNIKSTIVHTKEIKYSISEGTLVIDLVDLSI